MLTLEEVDSISGNNVNFAELESHYSKELINLANFLLLSPNSKICLEQVLNHPAFEGIDKNAILAGDGAEDFEENGFSE